MHPDRVLPGLTTSESIQPIRILLVDDKPAVVDGVCKLFAKQQALAVVGAAINGRDVLEKVAQHKPDVVVMDVHIPERNGREAAASMRRQFPGIRIIMISLDEDAPVRADCYRAGPIASFPRSGCDAP